MEFMRIGCMTVCVSLVAKKLMDKSQFHMKFAFVITLYWWPASGEETYVPYHILIKCRL